MPAIEVVISLLMVVLFYSLLATVVMELISSVFSFRAKHLIKTLRSILSAHDRRETLLDDFTQHPLYQQLSGKGYGKNTPPSYITPKDFRTILVKIVSSQDNSQGTSDNWRQKLEQLPDPILRDLLLQYWEEAGEEWEVFSQRIEDWYEEIMTRASGWYKRNVQTVLIVLGLGIAVLFNVDIIQVYQHLLSTSQDDLTELVDLAQTITTIEVNTDNLSTNNNLQFPQPINDELYELLEENLSSMHDPLGIGWGETTYGNDINFWLLKLLGWILMALCISKGAPFWFDLLKKAVNFRSTGGLPIPQLQPVVQSVSPPSPDKKYRRNRIIHETSSPPPYSNQAGTTTDTPVG